MKFEEENSFSFSSDIGVKTKMSYSIEPQIATGNAGELQALVADLTRLYKPVTETERLLIERLAASEWQFSCAFRLLTEEQQKAMGSAGR
jgi:hypothetical protein